MFDALAFRRDLAEQGKYFGPEVRELHMKFSIDGPKAGYVYVASNGDERLVHGVRYPAYALTADSKVVDHKVEREPNDKTLIIAEYDIVVTPDSAGKDAEPYVFWSLPKQGAEIQKEGARAWLKWQETVVDIKEQNRPKANEADAQRLIAQMRIRLGQNKAGQEAAKAELAEMKAEKVVNAGKSK